MTPEQTQFRDDCADRLGIADLDIEWKPVDRPGGDDLNIAHVHGSDDLRAFVVEYNFDDAGAPEIRRAIIHESLHIAFRHAGAVIVGLPDPVSRAWLTGAIEEDTESLAERLAALWP